MLPFFVIVTKVSIVFFSRAEGTRKLMLSAEPFCQKKNVQLNSTRHEEVLHKISMIVAMTADAPVSRRDRMITELESTIDELVISTVTSATSKWCLLEKAAEITEEAIGDHEKDQW